ncbi:hypothetical protein ACE38W_17625 [Chitinophaga sp. Hz27]|uniref:hypothetical protein n=1 Tax=Chitinophaga sp. Hz27 TaxID=3347169 RepID=UPI0035E282C8
MESQEESFKASIVAQKEYAKKQLADNLNLIGRFKKLAASKGIELQDEDFEYIETIGIVANYPGILWLLYPELVRDKDGLVEFATLLKTFKKNEIASGYLYGESCIVMAHPYFRRGFNPTSHFTSSFVNLLWKLKDSRIVHSIALDEDRVRINVDNTQWKEFDTWYGAKFNGSIIQIPNGPIKLCPPSDLAARQIDFLFAECHSLVMKWDTSKEGIKNFYAEEFKTENLTVQTVDGEFYPTRYVHSEVSPNINAIKHFDGAIHFYDLEEYLALRDSDLNYNSKSLNQIKGKSKKMFMLNGNIETSTWIDMISHFMHGNPLVFEYFQGSYPSETQKILDAINANLI